MSAADRTMLAVGRSTYSVPKLTKRIAQVTIAVALTCLAIFVVLSLNTVLTTHAGWRQGFDLWFGFVRRSDILGTMILTAAVTTATIYWAPIDRK
jgi:ABC-type sulfate transport system permease subunit